MKYPVAIMTAVLTFLNFIAGGLGILGVLPEKWVGLFVLLVGGLTAAWGVFTHLQVTPLSDPKAADGTPLVPVK